MIAIGRARRVAACAALLAIGAGMRPALARPTGAHAFRIERLTMINGRVGWAVSDHILWRTTDGAHTWRNSMPASARHPIELAASFLSATQAWIATASASDYEVSAIAVYHTTTGGRNWRTSKVPILGGVEPGQRLVFSDARHGWLLINEGVGAGQNPYVLVRTIDGGRHWAVAARYDPTRRTRGAFTGCDCTDAFTFVNPTTGWVTGDPFAFPFVLWLYRSTDGGHTWVRQTPLVPRGFTHGETYPPRFSGGGVGTLPVQLFGRPGVQAFELYVTRDGGAHWAGTRLLHLRSGGFAQSFADSRHGWVTDGRMLYRTTDGGRHWVVIHPREPAGVQRFWRVSGQPEVAAIDFVNGQVGFTIGLSPSGKPLPFVLRTIDGGRSWQYQVTVD